MKFLKHPGFLIGLILLFPIIIGLTSIKHPIILKWLKGSARIVGRPIKATVFTNGSLNKEISVYHVYTYWNEKPADYYLLHFYSFEYSRVKYLSLNKKDNYAGIPDSTNVANYDIIAGMLFQSEIGAQFSPLQDNMEDFDFYPKPLFINDQIILNIPEPVKEINCDSLRVVL